MSSTTNEERREAAANLRKIHLGGANKDLIELMLSDAVGAWCKRTGRVMLGDAFYVRMDTGAGCEREDNNKSDYAFVDVDKRVADQTDKTKTSQIDCRTYQTGGNPTRQLVNGNID